MVKQQFLQKVTCQPLVNFLTPYEGLEQLGNIFKELGTIYCRMKELEKLETEDLIVFLFLQVMSLKEKQNLEKAASCQNVNVLIEDKCCERSTSLDVINIFSPCARDLFSPNASDIENESIKEDDKSIGFCSFRNCDNQNLHLLNVEAHEYPPMPLDDLIINTKIDNPQFFNEENQDISQDKYLFLPEEFN